MKVPDAHPCGKTGVNPEVRAHLRILETTDLHANLLPYDYFIDRPAPSIGLAQTAALVRQLRAGLPNCLLFDNGDFLQGNPLADWIARENNPAKTPSATDLHPVIAAMNTLGYDAGTLGNHEFDYGLAFLTRSISSATFPLVSANTFQHGDRGPRPIVPPYEILKRQILAQDGHSYPIRIGVIGFAPPTLVAWNRMVLKDAVSTCEIVVAAQTLVPQMRAAGADIIVALSHSGIGAALAVPDMEDASVPLAGVPGINVILTGHSHQVFPGPGIAATTLIDPGVGTLHGKPALMAGHNGSHVGIIDLTLALRQGRWTPVAHSVRTEPVALTTGPGHSKPRLPPDPAVSAAAAASHAAILALIREPLGATAVPLHSYFALVAPDPTLAVVAAAQTAHARRIIQGSPWSDLPVLSAVAPSKAGGLGGPANFIDVPPGPLEMRHAAELCVFPNALCVLEIDGAGVLAWLEHAAGLFCQITPGGHDQPLIRPGFPSYNFDVIAGLTYQINPSQPCRTDSRGLTVNPLARRIHDLRCNGRPVDPADRFVIATNSYRVGGGGGFAAAQAARIIHHSVETTRDILADYLRQTVPLRAVAERIWRFARLPGTSAWFDSGTDAPRMVEGLPLRHCGQVGSGAQRFELSFPG